MPFITNGVSLHCLVSLSQSGSTACHLSPWQPEPLQMQLFSKRLGPVKTTTNSPWQTLTPLLQTVRPSTGEEEKYRNPRSQLQVVKVIFTSINTLIATLQVFMLATFQGLHTGLRHNDNNTISDVACKVRRR